MHIEGTGHLGDFSEEHGGIAALPETELKSQSLIDGPFLLNGTINFKLGVGLGVVVCCEKVFVQVLELHDVVLNFRGKTYNLTI